MLIQAIICEYNPFHNGHAYQIKAGKTDTGSTHTLALMSGSIVQRGSFALSDKWLRAQTALLSGADLVCELPYAYAAQSAEYFAGGAIKILNALNCCDFLSFGSESGNLDSLRKIAGILAHEPPDFQKVLKDALNTGVSFPKARTIAFEALYGEHFSSYLREPNNILGIEYLKALLRTNSPITPVTIKRQGSGYHEQAIKTTTASASAIRKQIKAGLAAPEQALRPLLPYDPALLLDPLRENSCDWETSFTKALVSKIMSADLGSFRSL
ncbi:MAG: nucleotidyltransferase family protein, partial [Eubacterium sp.]